MTEAEYILGTDPDESERLRFQHVAWLQQAYALWSRAGIRAGDAVLDLGCGPGTTSFELARLVGPRGRVVARDESPRFLEVLAAERDRLGLSWVEPSLGRVEDLDLDGANLDAAYARWLLCWLPDPLGALRRIAAAVRPGGVLVFQDYLDWAAMKLLPPGPAHDRAIQACMQSWREGGGDIDVGERFPELARDGGLVLEHLQPVARAGDTGSLEWRWTVGFLRSYLPKLVERGTLRPDELEAFRAEMDAREEEGTSWVHAPTVVDVVLRKPS